MTQITTTSREAETQETLLTGQIRVLEMLAQGKPLETVLTACLEFCEAHSPDMLCSILLLDAEGKHLHHGAAPSLPDGYIKAIDGSPIGPAAGSCGTAAFKGEAVIVEDIATDPLWAVYKDIALPYGLRSCWSTPIFDAGHKVLGTFAMYYRKPGRPEAEHRRLIEMITHVAGIAIACRRVEDEKRRIFERISDAFVALDAQWRFTYVNARAGRMLDRDPAGLIGKHIWTEFPEAVRHEFRLCCEKAMRDQEPSGFEGYYPPHGKWYENRIYPDRDGVTIYFHDVTDRRRAEENLRQSEKMTAIGQLAGGIAHDFNNQLSVMLGYAGLLENRIADPELQRFASAIVRAANRSGDLTRNLLSFSRLGHVENVPIDVHELISELIDLLGHSFDRRISLQRRFNAGYAYVLGDPSCLHNALLNLALNARDAMPDGGTLEFATDSIDLPESPENREELSDLAPGAYLRIKVSDTGTGMTEAVMKRMFEPFFTTKPVGKGTGMGMASVFGAMRSHKGRILAESAVGQGATFHLYLPLTGMGQGKTAPRSSPVPEPSFQGMRVLIVDDEIPVRNLIAEMLKDGGHTIIGAAGGREGLRIFQECWREIDLVLLDMVMPEIDGFDTFQELRRINPEAKVIISSGYTADGKIEALIGQGAKGLLQKPYGKAQLEKALAGAME